LCLITYLLVNLLTMRGYMTISDEDKNNILQQHSTFYNGYATGNIPSVPQPLRVDNGPKDTTGINVNNRGEVSTYKNHLVNESKEEEVMEYEADDMDLSDVASAYDFESGGPEQFDDKNDIDFPPTYGDEESDYKYSDKSYGMDIDSLLSMFDGGVEADFDDEVPAYEFDSEGAMDTDLYEEEQCEGCGGEMYEEQGICEVCGGEMYEGECNECGQMYEELDEDIRESFIEEKERINEMFRRFNEFN